MYERVNTFFFSLETNEWSRRRILQSDDIPCNIFKVVREVDTRQREDRMNHLKSMSLFQDWSTKDLDAANAASKLVEYPGNTVSICRMA